MIFVLLFVYTLKWLVSLGKYSGFETPPMYGDFEAQRHWMEITYNLPIEDWYVNSSQNDLNYWGLDYPPLTAYHSWFLGYLSSKFNESWIVLDTSRGLHDIQHKVFMRLSVIISEIVFYLPSIFLLCRDATHLLIFLLYPALVVIDHAHFQYNCVSLGLFLTSICFLKTHPSLRRNVVCVFFFTLSLNFKQMQLYHAFPIFFYLLGCVMHKRKFVEKLFAICCLLLTLMMTFTILWCPFLQGKSSLYLKVISRIFPLKRGIFEDKVSNFWCTFNILFKLRNYFSQGYLVSLSAALTLLFAFPTSVHCLLKPTLLNLKVSLFNCALSFYLFSYQVHEKSILLAGVPLLMLMPEYPIATFHFSLLSTASMYPLACKDGILLQFYVVITCFLLVYHYFVKSLQEIFFSLKCSATLIVYILFISTLLASHAFQAPSKWPFLFPQIISFLSFTCFSLFLLYFYFQQFFKLRTRKEKSL